MSDRKYLIAYPIWNKQDMVPWLMEGIAKAIDPSRADLMFMFVNCIDDSKKNFDLNRSKLSAFDVDAFEYNGHDMWELDHHNVLLQRFSERLDCHCMICPQDDNRINGKTLLRDIDVIADQYGDQTGLIGGRDGYGFGYQGMVGSPHSLSRMKTRTLEIGEFEERIMLNTGPLIYFKHVLRIVGLHDSKNKIYAMDDYALRARFTHGLKNFVLGMDIDHRKFGPIVETEYPQGLVAQNLERLNSQWEKSIGRRIF